MFRCTEIFVCDILHISYITLWYVAYHKSTIRQPCADLSYLNIYCLFNLWFCNDIANLRRFRQIIPRVCCLLSMLGGWTVSTTHVNKRSYLNLFLYRYIVYGSRNCHMTSLRYKCKCRLCFLKDSIVSLLVEIIPFVKERVLFMESCQRKLLLIYHVYYKYCLKIRNMKNYL